MKKKYVAPMSALYSLNFTENIASSIGDDLETGVIKFTVGDSGCRGYFTGVEDAPVNTEWTSDFTKYLYEIYRQESEKAFRQIMANNCISAY